MERYVNGEWENRKVKCEIYVNIQHFELTTAKNRYKILAVVFTER